MSEQERRVLRVPCSVIRWAAIREIGKWGRDSGCWILDSGYWILDVREASWTAAVLLPLFLREGKCPKHLIALGYCGYADVRIDARAFKFTAGSFSKFSILHSAQYLRTLTIWV